MTQLIKLCYRNILETGTVTVTTEDASFPKYRLHNRDIGKLFKGTASASPFAILINQGAIPYEVDRLIIPAGHNLNGLACSLRYSTDNFAADDHTAHDWTQSDALLIDKEILDVTGADLVSNGGMEDGDPPTGWNAILNPETFERSAIQKHSGNYSLHINDSTASNGGGIRLISKTAGKKYKLGYWYYIVSGVLRASLIQGDGGGSLWDDTHSTTESWLYNEIIVEETVTGSSGGPQFINNSDSVPAEFYIDDVSVKEVVPTSLTKQYWKLNITAPATIVEMPEMFLTKSYIFQRNPSYGLAEGDDKNIEDVDSQSGRWRGVKWGEYKRYRRYELTKIQSAQKTDFQTWDRHCEGIKALYLEDHEGDLFFARLLNRRLLFAMTNEGRWATDGAIEFLEVL